MFRESPQNPQPDLLSSAGEHLDERRRRQLRDPNGWHNTFYEHVFRQIDESIFSVLYDEQMGAPNAPVDQLVGMMTLKTDLDSATSSSLKPAGSTCCSGGPWDL